ncbi:MAG: heme-binding domain-containing protein [Myxococcales bacterium]|nr:heme-binding domain-containing protein [Myxococcales bacterium]MCB9672469.1 heme-binding domain-containing protein [Alphaproteobacteria bacterium]MCB9692849.1 heme-binding domain-containing protein [Alphaproteobacteria bacterium]
MDKVRRFGPWVLGGLAVLLVVAQLVPYRVENPPVEQGPAWDSPATEALARRACFDCHSHEVKVPWYGHIAPFAWLVNHHVIDGREHLNLSTMQVHQKHAHEAAEEVREEKMPPGYYLALHPEARLSAEERAQLAAGLAATLGDDEH